MAPSVLDAIEPLSLYRDSLRGAFRENAADFFNRLMAKSGIDAAANAATVSELRVAEALAADDERAASLWGWATGIAIAATACAIAGAAYLLDCGGPGDDMRAAGCAAAAVAAATLLFWQTLPRRRARMASAQAHRSEAERLRAIAESQMAPLNALFDWDAPARIIEKTLPGLTFDPYFTEGRLAELHDIFGFDPAFTAGKSVLGAHSGEINGNPFVFARLLQMSWGSKTYSGSRTVSWMETERGPDGKIHVVTRSQTLTASITKPFPQYTRDTVLIYGNDAAPDLRFSREATSLSKAEDGFISRLRMKRRVHSLERFSRNLDDEYGYTIMGNREFEALFMTKDRSDEVQYRLLFTPLAQKQMLALLKDREVGYGDDFSFLKARKINVIRAAHLESADLDANPAKFASVELAESRRRFQGFCEEFFKATFFSLAPLLAIPLYSQTRTHENIYRDVLARTACHWEHESLANYLGENRFRHPLSVTRNILKTRVVGRSGDVAKVEVSASGFRTVGRTEYVPVTALNGRTYIVAVHWDEFLPVTRTSEIHASERSGMSLAEYRNAASTSAEWQEFFRNWGTDASRTAFRRGIVSF